jgi:hypothetical protein
MPEKHVEEAVRAAVAKALERQLPQFREGIVQQVLGEIGSGRESSTSGSIAGLQKAVSAIQAGSNQKEILRALLDNTILYSGRAALFVMKNGAATGWQGIGFSSNEGIKDFALDVSSGVAAEVLRARTSEDGRASDFDHRFVATFGAPADGTIVLLPLVLKDKISALVYADAGTQGGSLNTAALDVLVRATSAWLEVVSQRKQAQKDGPEAEMHSAPAANDPFAAHAPVHSAAAEYAAEPVPAVAIAAAAGAGGTSVAAGLSPEDADVHRKAQRFARLLMDEIKLYNKAKVADGRKHKDLYDRLKEDIEKSRATYLKRYGNTSAASADYFNQELVRSLAEDDASLLGKNFQPQ